MGQQRLEAAEFSSPLLGRIFLRYPEKTYAAEELLGAVGSGGRRRVSRDDCLAEGVTLLPEIARFSYLQSLTGGNRIGKAINEAMKCIDAEHSGLTGAFPHN